LLRELIQPVETDPKGLENEPHSTSTSLRANDINHTVIAAEGRSFADPTVQIGRPAEKPRPVSASAYHITPTQLVELAPRLENYMPARFRDYSWPSIVEAALWLSGELGVNRTLWATACQTMGREIAAIALAIVSTRPPHHFTSGPGGYFAGMLRKYEKGELRLERTLWKLKDQAWGADRKRRDRFAG
jgi:replication initiation protein RepC